MKRLFSIVLLLAAGFVIKAYGQKISVVSGTATVKLEDHLSMEDTRKLAREQARHQALESKYGTFISKDSRVEIEEGTASVSIIGESQVKGEWLETIKETFTEQLRRAETKSGAAKEVWITCNIKGRARKIVSPAINFDFLPLHCPDLNCAGETFENKSQFYLYFKSAVNGYLSVFLADDAEAYRILPYNEMPQKYIHSVPVKADQEYIFFHPAQFAGYFEGFPYYYTDEIVLDTEQDQTAYQLFVVLSSKPYTKPMLASEIELPDAYKNPKSISRENFDTWVLNNRMVDTDFFYKTSNLTVKK